MSNHLGGCSPSKVIATLRVKTAIHRNQLQDFLQGIGSTLNTLQEQVEFL